MIKTKNLIKRMRIVVTIVFICILSLVVISLLFMTKYKIGINVTVICNVVMKSLVARMMQNDCTFKSMGDSATGTKEKGSHRDKK